MANTSKKKKPEKEYSVSADKGFRKQLSAINNLIGQANLSMYGTDRTSDVDVLNSTFQTILHFPLAECTATAMDDQSIRGQIGRKFGSACENEFQFLAGIIPDPAR